MQVARLHLKLNFFIRPLLLTVNKTRVIGKPNVIFESFKFGYNFNIINRLATLILNDYIVVYRNNVIYAKHLKKHTFTQND